MKVLPGFDRTTERSEFAVFVTLGLAGVMLVGLALAQMTEFIGERDPLLGALGAPRSETAGKITEEPGPHAGAKSPARHTLMTGVQTSTGQALRVVQ
jgi:hypothetical protein